MQNQNVFSRLIFFKKNKKGFTLIELLLVISIIALLTSLILVLLSGARAQGRDSKRKAETDSLRKALALYYADYGTYPTTTSWVKIEDTGNAEVAILRSKLQPYLPTPPSDPLYGNMKSGDVPFSYQYMSTTTESGEVAYKIHTELETGLYASYETYSSGGEGIVYGGGGDTGAYAAAIYNFNDGTAADISGNGNNGTIFGATPVAGPPELGNALSFDGNDYVEVGNAASLNITDAITIELWFKMLTNIDAWDRLVAKSTPTANFPYTMYGVLFVYSNYVGDETKGNLRFELASGGQQHIVYTKTIIPVGEWMHAVATYDATNKMRLYLNGALDSEDMWRYDSSIATKVDTLLTGKIDTNNAPLSMGRSYYNLDYFNGVIDEVRIYSRGLTTAEIKSQYYAGLGNLFARGK